MAARRLGSRPVERVWGRRDLPAPFAPPLPTAEPIGEIWFEDAAGGDAALLVKYLFTAERLSVQVHPGDKAARARGLPRGKDEAWYILSAEPGAAIGLGLTRDVSKDELRAAAIDGSIERLLDWREVHPGELIYSPAGTIHAIGAGLGLIEIQQNLDLTYRLYDYGRPRDLHLEEALDVAERGPWSPPTGTAGAFIVERRQSGDAGDEAVVVPLADGGTIDGAALEAGTVWRVEGSARIEGADALVAFPRASS